MHALAPATRRTYETGQRHYANFCRLQCWPICCASDQSLARFVAYLADVVRVAPSTIKVYLAGVRALHIERGWPDPCERAPLTQRVLTGVKRVHGMHPRLLRLPVTLNVLRQLVAHLHVAEWLHPTDRLMMIAACTLAFFGFLRCSEFTSGALRSDVVVSTLPRPHLTLTLRASKTDPFRRGCTVAIGSSPGVCCAVSAMASYLRATSYRSPSAPLFQLVSGAPLLRPVFSSFIQRALTTAGNVNARFYMSHSFRIGAATSAAAAGIPAWLIKTLGRWSSDAYLVYIRTPLQVRLAVAHYLAQHR